jgi:hypothetical protein
MCYQTQGTKERAESWLESGDQHLAGSVERVSGSIGYRPNTGNTNHNYQREHHCVLDCGGAIFLMNKLPKTIQYPLKHKAALALVRETDQDRLRWAPN